MGQQNVIMRYFDVLVSKSSSLGILTYGVAKANDEVF